MIYINEVYQNNYHQYERSSNEANSIYGRDIYSSPDIITNWNCVFGCCGNLRKKGIPE